MKPIDILGMIVSIIALIGSLLTMYVLVLVKMAMDQFTATASQLGQAAAGVTQFTQLFGILLWVGGFFAAIFFLTSLYGIWSAWQKLRSKK